MQISAIHGKALGWESKTVYKVSNSAVPRDEIKLRLPPRLLQVSNQINNMALLRVDGIYRQLGRKTPGKITVLDLESLSSHLEGIYKAKCSMLLAENQSTSFYLHDRLYRNSFFITNDSSRDLNAFLADRRKRAYVIKSQNRQFHVKKEGGQVIAYEGIPLNIDSQIRIASSLARLRDILETGSLDAAIDYANHSRSLNNADMHDELLPLFSYLAGEGENPKLYELNRILLEMQDQRKKCLVFCEGEDLLRTLQAFANDAFGVYSRSVGITNHPSELLGKQKGNEGAYDVAILYTPSKKSIDIAWNLGVSKIFVLINKGTSDEDKYWQNAKAEDSHIR